MLKNLKMEVFYPHPPQKVWQVLTNRRALAKWLMENNFEPHVGHKFQFQHSALPGLDGSIDPSAALPSASLPSASLRVNCEVIELDEPKRLSFTWQDSVMCQPSIVTWTLEPVDGGTRLHLQHKYIDVLHVTSLYKPVHFSQPWQSQFKYESTVVTQRRPLVNHPNAFQSIPVGRYEGLDSVILSYFLNGGWNYRLNQRLAEIIVDFAIDK